MVCPKCKNKEFILFVSKAVYEKYKIKNGKRSKRPFYKDEDDMGGEFDNTVICTKCNTEYAVVEKGYDDFMKENFDFNEIDLEKDGLPYEY